MSEGRHQEEGVRPEADGPEKPQPPQPTADNRATNG